MKVAHTGPRMDRYNISLGGRALGGRRAACRSKGHHKQIREVLEKV